MTRRRSGRLVSAKRGARALRVGYAWRPIQIWNGVVGYTQTSSGWYEREVLA